MQRNPLNLDRLTRLQPAATRPQAIPSESISTVSPSRRPPSFSPTAPRSRPPRVAPADDRPVAGAARRDARVTSAPQAGRARGARPGCVRAPHRPDALRSTRRARAHARRGPSRGRWPSASARDVPRASRDIVLRDLAWATDGDRRARRARRSRSRPAPRRCASRSRIDRAGRTAWSLRFAGASGTFGDVSAADIAAAIRARRRSTGAPTSGATSRPSNSRSRRTQRSTGLALRVPRISHLVVGAADFASPASAHRARDGHRRGGRVQRRPRVRGAGRRRRQRSRQVGRAHHVRRTRAARTSARRTLINDSHLVQHAVPVDRQPLHLTRKRSPARSTPTASSWRRRATTRRRRPSCSSPRGASDARPQPGQRLGARAPQRDAAGGHALRGLARRAARRRHAGGLAAITPPAIS